MNIHVPILALCLALVAACGEVDRLADCAQICDRYAECVDSNYDVDDCTQNCADEARDSDAADEGVDDCESCLDGRSCAESAFPCLGECAGIVP